MAVSPESMQASPPSRIALATSVTSARVGRRECCMLSSICVAMITGFCCSWQVATIRFCTTGIWATSISTPRSPRATITPSAAATIAVQADRALPAFRSWRSRGPPSLRSRSSSFSSRTSAGLADEAQADEVDAALGRPDGVLAVVVAHAPAALSLTPGRFTPCRLRIRPGCTTRQRAASAVFSSTVSRPCRRPASRGRRPAIRRPAARRSSPTRRRGRLARRARSETRRRRRSRSLPPGNSPRRILGPARSTSTAIGWLSSALTWRIVASVSVVLFAAGMGHVQAEHVDPGRDQRGQLLARAAGRADRGDDLGAGTRRRFRKNFHDRGSLRQLHSARGLIHSNAALGHSVVKAIRFDQLEPSI